MSKLRFLAAAAAGGVFCVWLATFTMAYLATGVILWDGRDHQGVQAGYVAMLYAPPLLAVLLAYLALRKDRADHHA